jgi:hypothetical protein
LTVVEGNINAQKYIEAIDNLVWPVIARHSPDDNYVFPDNAPLHKERVVKEYMEETDLRGMIYPAQNPDFFIPRYYRKMCGIKSNINYKIMFKTSPHPSC